MDYFFAQVEERENPQFRGKPVVVGADPKKGQGRGVVSTANYEARKYGIHSALPISKAYQLCHNAVFLPVNIELYQKVSERIMEIIKKFSKTWEIVSLDEAYLNIPLIHIKKPWQNYVYGLAKELKQEIFEKEKLTSTIGIGPNKLIAKMATNKAKPNGLLVIQPEQIEEFLDPLDIEDLPGIGVKTGEKLRALGINKIKELKKLPKKNLRETFGKVGERIYEIARGIDETPVISEEIIKSIGREHTFEKDTRDPEIIFEIFDRIIEKIWEELVENKFSFKTVTVICRFQGFETHTKSGTLKEPNNSLDVLTKKAKKLILKFLLENKKPVRLVGLRVKVR